MKYFLTAILILSATMLALSTGCSGSGRAERDEMPPPPPVNQKEAEKPAIGQPAQTTPETPKSPQPELSRQEIVQPQGATREPAAVGNYAVQLGAYKMPDNADRISAMAKERFSLNVITLFDPTEELYKVYLGDFETKDAARTFRDVMALKFPEDYKDAWVAEKPKK